MSRRTNAIKKAMGKAEPAKETKKAIEKFDVTTLNLHSELQEELCLEIVFTANLIQNNFSQKAMEEMLMKHMGIAFKREKKVPREVVEAAIIRNIENRVCIPVSAIKAATLDAASQFVEFEKSRKALRSSIWVVGQSIPIDFDTMVPRLDMVTVFGRTGPSRDVRFRPEFSGVRARFVFNHSPSVKAQMLLDCVQRAGRGGLGEWRPTRNGTFGTFEVSNVISNRKEINEVKRLCAPPLVRLEVPHWALDKQMSVEEIADIIEDGKRKEGVDEVAPDDAPKAKRTGKRVKMNGVAHA